jgi:hypothetical protein
VDDGGAERVGGHSVVLVIPSEALGFNGAVAEAFHPNCRSLASLEMTPVRRLAGLGHEPSLRREKLERRRDELESSREELEQ